MSDIDEVERKPRILIIDDDEKYAKSLVTMLQHCLKHAIVRSHYGPDISSASVLDSYCDMVPDLVICDEDLGPGKEGGGIAITKEIRQKYVANQKVILMSMEDDHWQMAQEMGADFYHKGGRINLCNTVKRVLHPLLAG